MQLSHIVLNAPKNETYLGTLLVHFFFLFKLKNL